MHEKCSDCGFRYLQNFGDPFIYQAIIDRGFFVFPLIVLLFFGLHHFSFWLFFGLTVVLTGIMVVTTGFRYGLCVSLDYWARLKWGDLKEKDPVGNPGQIQKRFK